MTSTGILKNSIMAGVVVLALSTATVAQPGPGHGPGRGMPFHTEMIEKVAMELGLEEAQLKKIRKLAYDTQEKTIELDSKMQKAFLDLRRMMDEDKPDVKKVMSQIETIGALDTQMKKIQIGMLLTVREMLSKEQREKLKKLMMQRPPRGRHCPPPGPGPGPKPKPAPVQ